MKDLKWLDKEIEDLKKQVEEKTKLKEFLLSEEIPATVGDRIRKERIIRRFSTFELAVRASVPQADVLRIEANDLNGISEDALDQIADGLDITYEYLVSGDTNGLEERRSQSTATPPNFTAVHIDVLQAFERWGTCTITDLVRRGRVDRYYPLHIIEHTAGELKKTGYIVVGRYEYPREFLVLSEKGKAVLDEYEGDRGQQSA